MPWLETDPMDQRVQVRPQDCSGRRWLLAARLDLYMFRVRASPVIRAATVPRISRLANDNRFSLVNSPEGTAHADHCL
jgi:hypothetical protein